MINTYNRVCFVAGTMILTATGLVAIENIGAGDKVRYFEKIYLEETVENDDLRAGYKALVDSDKYQLTIYQ